MLMAQLPILRLLVLPMWWGVRLLTLFARVGSLVGRHVFMLVDSAVSRRMEFRADRFAAERLSAEPGLTLFKALERDFEPSMDLYARHPSFRQRIELLEDIRLSEHLKRHVG
jgi:Zn-dependent protease with chaperone function